MTQAKLGDVIVQTCRILPEKVAGADDDETLLSNLSHIVANDYGYVPKVWDRWVTEGQAPAIIPVQTVYDTAVRGKIDIFIITGRKESDRAATESYVKRMVKAGLSEAAFFILSPLPGSAL